MRQRWHDLTKTYTRGVLCGSGGNPLSRYVAWTGSAHTVTSVEYVAFTHTYSRFAQRVIPSDETARRCIWSVVWWGVCMRHMGEGTCETALAYETRMGSNMQRRSDRWKN